jgi:excisionase family DNA binding protein
MTDRRPALTVKEIQAALGGASRPKVYQLLASGKLPSFLLGKKMRRVLAEDFDQYIERLKQEDAERRKALADRRKVAADRAHGGKAA